MCWLKAKPVFVPTGPKDVFGSLLHKLQIACIWPRRKAVRLSSAPTKISPKPPTPSRHQGGLAPGAQSAHKSTKDTRRGRNNINRLADLARVNNANFRMAAQGPAQGAGPLSSGDLLPEIEIKVINLLLDVGLLNLKARPGVQRPR